MADLAEEEGGWLSVEEMMGQIHKNDRILVEQSTSQVNLIIVFRSGIILKPSKKFQFDSFK